MPKATYTDAIALLKADHRKVEDLFEQFEKARTDDRKQTLAREICSELKIHTAIEEEIFYPAFREKIEADMLDEAHVEHDGAKVLINDIESSSRATTFTMRSSRCFRKRSNIMSMRRKCLPRAYSLSAAARMLTLSR